MKQEQRTSSSRRRTATGNTIRHTRQAMHNNTNEYSPMTTPPTVDRREWHAKRRRLRMKQRQPLSFPSLSSLRSLLASPRDALQRVWRITQRILIVCAVVLLIVGFLLYRQVSHIAEAIVVHDVRPNPSIANPIVGGMNVLIIGTDERSDYPEEGVRSDTLMVAHIDGLGGWVNLLSIPRDTEVVLPDIGTTKINVAYGQGYARATDLYGVQVSPQQGGMALAAETVEDFLSQDRRTVRVDYTMQVNFEGFVQVIDALGGITIDVPTYIYDDAYPTEDYGTMVVEFMPGVQHMDGTQALIYARTRHADSDFGRNQRQQQVLHAMVAAWQQKSWLQKLWLMPALLDSLQGTNPSDSHDTALPSTIRPILTTMPFDRIDIVAGLLLLASHLDTDSIGHIRITPDTVAAQEIGSNLIWDSDDIQEQVRLFLRKPEPTLNTSDTSLPNTQQ